LDLNSRKGDVIFATSICYRLSNLENPGDEKKPLVGKAVLISAAGSQDAQSLANGRKVELGKSAKRI